MKYILVLGDGMADEPLAALEGKTPMESADTPMMDELAVESEIGLVHTIPEGMSPGSDTANLSVLGYDPKIYYTGRSPLEALSIGVPMTDTDVALRCNLVTLSEDEQRYEEKSMMDHSADEISTKDARILLEAVAQELADVKYQFYPLWANGAVVPLTPPHDILGQAIGRHLPEDETLRNMQKRSYEILSQHPLNLKRKEMGLKPANSCWFWGAGTRPALTSFEEKFGKKGAMISAVDLLKGIAVGAQMENITVEGANGGLHTNYEGKAQAAVAAVIRDGSDFVYIHIEAPDEMGHQGSIERKIKAIEYVDGKVVRTVKESMDASGEAYRMLILPDHPTPVAIRTHTSDPVPYLLYDSTKKEKHTWHYNEKEAQKSGNVVQKGYELIEKLFQRG
jgi:2,3-bisphosphoglycerate-independent phosphoglycerate mutase